MRITMIYRIATVLIILVTVGLISGWKMQENIIEVSIKPGEIDKLAIYGECDQKEEDERQRCSSFNMKSYFKKNMVYPKLAKENMIEGKVVIEITINEHGDMENIHVQKTANKELNEEALRLCNMLGVWKPAMRKKKPVASRIFVPVNFSARSEAFKR